MADTTTIRRFSNLPISPDFIWPIDPAEGPYVTSFYGCRADSDANDARCDHGFRMHNGIDVIAENRRVPIRAIADGVVTHATPHDPADPLYSYTPGFGNYGRIVAIQHAPWLHSLSAHLSRVDVVPGQRIRKGQFLGLMGKSRGSAANPRDEFHDSGAHLHFETMGRKYPVSPSVDRVNPLIGLKEGARFFIQRERILQCP